MENLILLIGYQCAGDRIGRDTRRTEPVALMQNGVDVDVKTRRNRVSGVAIDAAAAVELIDAVVETILARGVVAGTERYVIGSRTVGDVLGVFAATIGILPGAQIRK